jgi:hypothetical protein
MLPLLLLLLLPLLQAFTRLGKAHVGSNDPAGAAAAAAAADGSKPSSVDALLAAEVAELKNKKNDRFKRHDTGVRGTLFVEFPKDEGEMNQSFMHEYEPGRV